jgi:hypothetical protein
LAVVWLSFPTLLLSLDMISDDDGCHFTFFTHMSHRRAILFVQPNGNDATHRHTGKTEKDGAARMLDMRRLLTAGQSNPLRLWSMSPQHGLRPSLPARLPVGSCIFYLLFRSQLKGICWRIDLASEAAAATSAFLPILNCSFHGQLSVALAPTSCC